MKNKTTCRRCVECSGEFTPDPRVGDRQVTCGAEGCQRSRHAEQCRRWRAGNADVARAHYGDVVVPFRQKQPDYQSRWRWSRRLREIREEMGSLGAAALSSLQTLVADAERLALRAMGSVQSGVLAGEKLRRTITAVQATITALEQLDASTAELRELGL